MLHKVSLDSAPSLEKLSEARGLRLHLRWGIRVVLIRLSLRRHTLLGHVLLLARLLLLQSPLCLLLWRLRLLLWLLLRLCNKKLRTHDT